MSKRKKNGNIERAIRDLAADSPTVSPHRDTPEERPRVSRGAWEGTIITPKLEGYDDPDWDLVFAFWGLDPKLWQVDGDSIKVNSWEGPASDGETKTYHQYKATIRRRTTTRLDVDELVKQIGKWKRPKHAGEKATGGAFVVNCADWQIGGRGGTEAAVLRVLSALDEVHERAKQAAKQGVDHLLVVSLGDIVEGFNTSYKNQPFTIDATLSEQSRVARHLLKEVLKRLVPLFTEVTVAAVRGNHGQKSKETTPEDNVDLDYVEGVMEACRESDWGSHIRWMFPEKDVASQVFVEVAGTYIVVAHGDEWRGSADKGPQWWKNTAFQRHANLDLAHFLLLGHRHHFRWQECGEDRWLVQCPAMDGGSRWFADGGGEKAKPGILVFNTKDGRWWDSHICTPTEGLVAQ